MLDHIGFPVTDFARSKAFYVRALAPLGFRLIMEVNLPRTARTAMPALAPTGRTSGSAPASRSTGRLHVAFTAKNRAEVRAFYEAALAAGGMDNGAPGLRPHYHENYYGAFVLDPDGHNIEAVNHLPE